MIDSDSRKIFGSVSLPRGDKRRLDLGSVNGRVGFECGRAHEGIQDLGKMPRGVGVCRNVDEAVAINFTFPNLEGGH